MNLLDGTDQPSETNEREELLNKWKDKSKEELLEAKINSDLYIKTIERQKDDIKEDYLKQREELLARDNLKELRDQLNATKSSSDITKAEDGNREPKYDPKEIELLISNKIKETKIVEKQAENFSQVQNKLQEKYGNNYRAVLKEQQSTLGLSDEDVNNLAMKSPSAFFKLMGLDAQKTESFQTPPRSNQRNDNFAPKGETKRDWAYYQELKKTNPTLYLDRKIAIQMHNDVMEMGEARFYGNSI